MARSWTRRSRLSRARRAEAGRAPLTGALLGALALVVGSAALGLAVNHFSPRGIPILPPPAEAQRDGPALPQFPMPPGVTAMTAEEAHAAFTNGSALFLDARDPQEYAESHIPGALNLPPQDFETVFPDLYDQVESAPSLIVYCQGVECGDAVEVAERLVEIVSQPISVLEPGWRSWREAGYPATEGSQP